MKETIKKFLKSKYGRWLLIILIFTSGGTYTFQKMSTKVIDTVNEAVSDSVSDAISNIENTEIVKNAGNVIENVSDVSDTIKQKLS